MGDGRTTTDNTPGSGSEGTPQGTANGHSHQGAGDRDRTFTQADVDRVVSDRLSREREKYADYDDLRAKAAKFDEHQAAQQTDLEKLQGQYEELLGKSARTEQQLRITRAAAKHGLTDEAAAFLHGETDEEVDAAAAKLAALTNHAAEPDGGTPSTEHDGPTTGRRPDPSQGRGSTGDGATSLAAGADRYRRGAKNQPTTS